MRSYKVRELLKIRNGKDHKELKNGNIPIFGSGGLMRFGDKYLYDKESILLPRKGTLSNIQYVDEPFWTVDTIYYSEINDDLVDGYYLYCYLTSLDLSKLNSGTGVPSMTFDAYYNIEVSLPELKIQKKASNLLKRLKTKIELNNRINTELEAMAKTIYDYWFVQFDFPDKNRKPYKSSGGKMVWNEELKTEIPDGWACKKLGDVVVNTGTGLNPRDNFLLGEGENYYVTIKNIEQGRVVLDNRCDRISDKSLEIINRRSDLQIGDILFTSIEPVGITYLILERPKNWNINESVFTIRPNYDILTSEYLFMFLSGDYIKNYTKNVAAGSIHKGVRHGVLKDCKFILSDKKLIDDFTTLINPILKRIDLVQKENQQLASLRDWLLPMLMNGQVKVN